MPRILVPVDGSDASMRTVRHVIGLKEAFRNKLEVLLVNVQAPVPMKLLLLEGRPSEIDRLEGPAKAHGAELQAAAKAALDGAGIENTPHVEIGEAAPAIASLARTHHCEMIVMGTRGAGSIAGLILGSVSNKVVHLSSVPVLLVP
jgi:nucleotide-binding universal stress UspA family protein